MSKIGKLPISIPDQVRINMSGDKIVVSGPKGELSFLVPPSIKVEEKEGKVLVSRKDNEVKTKALHGTVRQSLANMIKGVSEVWSKTLELVGTGYRANLEGEELVLSLGFSHPVKVSPPSGIKFETVDGKIKVSGVDKALVGQVAAKIKAARPPDPYKGKGIRYEGEQIKLKPGKAAKVGVAQGE